MINTIYFFLPGIIALGLMTSYTDIKNGKISNKHILFALIYSLIVYVILIFTVENIRVDYFVELGFMLPLMLFIGFIIWYVGLWTAGDAKLFFAYSALIPLSVYKYGALPYFSATNILINTFIPFAFFLFVWLMFKTTMKQKLIVMKNALQPKKLAMLAIALFAFLWIISMLFSVFGISPDFFVTIFFVFIVMIIIEKIFPIKMVYIMIGIAILRFFFDKTVYTLDSVKFFLIIFVAFIILRFFILELGYGMLTKDMDIILLKKGMIPAEEVYIEKGEYKKNSLLYFSLFSYLHRKTKKRKYLFEPTAEGLSEKDVEKLKKLEKRLGFEHLKIYQSFSFAPFMFAGVLLTLLVQGSLFIFLALFF